MWCSVVTTTELSPPPWSLASTEPTPPFYSLLGGLSGHCFLTFAAESSDSHLNAVSFDCGNAWRVSPVSHTAHLPCTSTSPLPTRKQRQHCRDSRDSLSTILSETVVMTHICHRHRCGMSKISSTDQVALY